MRRLDGGLLVSGATKINYLWGYKNDLETNRLLSGNLLGHAYRRRVVGGGMIKKTKLDAPKRAYRKNGALTVRCNVSVNALDRDFLMALAKQLTGDANLSGGIGLACDALRKTKPKTAK